jgi:hypothetical protein
MTLLIYGKLWIGQLDTESLELLKAVISMSGGVLSTLFVWGLNRRYEIKRRDKQEINQEQTRSKSGKKT